MDVTQLLAMDPRLLLVPVTMIAVGIVSKLGLPDKWLPLASTVFGLACGLAVIGVTVQAGLIGIILGAAASGIYDHKSLFNG